MKKIILITGSSSGIGLATARQLIAEGHTVYASTRNNKSEHIINEIGGHPVRIEMTDPSTMEQAVKEIIEKEGRIDVLFNNAGYGLYGAVEDVTIDEARHQFEVNLFGLARLTQLVLPHMRAQGQGIVINTSSIGGKVHTPLGAWYHATKHALEGWSDCLRLELEPHGINVVIIEPGMIQTQFAQTMIQTLQDKDRTGAYDELTNAMVKAGEDADGFDGSGPQVIADVVSRAIAADRPRTRYHAGKLSTLVLTARRWLSDRMYDKFIMYQVNQIIKQSHNQ